MAREYAAYDGHMVYVLDQSLFADRQIDRQKDRKIERYKDRKIDRQQDRQLDRQINRYGYVYIYINIDRQIMTDRQIDQMRLDSIRLDQIER